MTHYPDHHIMALTTVQTSPSKEIWVQLVNLDGTTGNTFSMKAATDLI